MTSKLNSVIRNPLPEKWANLCRGIACSPLPIFYRPAVDSTSSEARRAAERGAPEGSVFLADVQTRGRGTRDRPWHSSDPEGLYFSILLRPSWKLSDCLILTRLAAASVYEAIGSRLRKEPGLADALRIKPPNDILLRSRKLCGILVESASVQENVEFVVVGIGVNANQTDFPEWLASRATSLRLETGRYFDPAELLVGVIRRLWSRYNHLRQNGPESLAADWNDMIRNEA